MSNPLAIFCKETARAPGRPARYGIVMTGIAWLGRRLFAAGFLGFAALEAINVDFVQGQAPPGAAEWPGRLVSAYASGAFFLVVGLVLLLDRGGTRGRGRYALLAAAALIFVFGLLRQVPVALADTHFGPGWFNLGKWLALAGGLVTISGVSPWPGRLTFGAFLVMCGIQHFLFTASIATLVPTWIPGALFWTYFAAVALIAGGVGMNLPPSGRLAATLVGAMIFTWLIILHIPRALAATGAAQRLDEWNSVFEALSFSGLAFVVAGTWPARSLQKSFIAASRANLML